MGEAVRVFVVPLRLDLRREAVGEALLEDDVDGCALDVPFWRRSVGHLDAEDAIGGQRFDVKQRGGRIAGGGATVDEQGGRLVHGDESDRLAVGRFQAWGLSQEVEGGGEDLRFGEALRSEGQAAVLHADDGAFGAHDDLLERLRLELQHDRAEVAPRVRDGACLVSQMLHAEQVGTGRGKQAEGAIVFAHGRLQVGGIGGGEDQGGLRHGLAGGVGQSAGDALLCTGGDGEQQACCKDRQESCLPKKAIRFHHVKGFYGVWIYRNNRRWPRPFDWGAAANGRRPTDRGSPTLCAAGRGRTAGG